jgi:hypothetical protein
MSAYLDWLQGHPAGQLVNERRDSGSMLALSGKPLPEYRTARQARRRQTRTGAEFHRYVEELLRAQPRTVTGYRARLAALEELVRQTG